jgi:hypothetical protein
MERGGGGKEDVEVLLRQAKAELVRMANECSAASQFERAQRLLCHAQSVNEIQRDLETGLVAHHTLAAGLPHFYVDVADKLVMRATSKRGGQYQHRVRRAHYDLVVGRLAKMIRDGDEFFSTQDLQDRREMPLMEPLQVVRLLAHRGLVEPLRRGHFKFKSPRNFTAEAAALWDALPRQ